MITLHQGQQKYWDNRLSENLVYEDRRWGKTTLLQYIALDQIKIPGRKILFLANSLKMADYNYHNFKFDMRDHEVPVSHIHKRHLFMSNGSMILFSDKYDRGTRFHVYLCDDVDLYTHQFRFHSYDIIWKTCSKPWPP